VSWDEEVFYMSKLNEVGMAQAKHIGGAPVALDCVRV
jgi:hypothetical protein